MKIVVEANSIEELRELLEKLTGNAPIASCVPKKPANVHIDVLGLSIRTFKNITEFGGIQTVDQLLEYSDLNLLRIPNISRKAVAEIRTALKEHGFS